MKERSFSIIAMSIICGSAAVATAQPRILIAPAAGSSIGDCRYTDPQAKLMNTGLFSAVDIFDARTATPTLAQLQTYDAVITWGNFTYSDPAAMGDVLADYLDAGGGVVVAVFANVSGWRLGGRWISGGYETIIGDSGSTTGLATLGTVHEPGHPIMNGINAFSGGTSSFRPAVTNLNPGTTSIADWSDGRVLVAVGALPGNVGLGFYPPSSDCSASFWDSSTDGAALMANALVFAAGGGSTGCYANCDGSTVEPVLNVDDFTCFINEFAASQTLPHEQQVTAYANCDGSTVAPALNVDDFTCFINEFAAGCN